MTRRATRRTVRSTVFVVAGLLAATSACGGSDSGGDTDGADSTTSSTTTTEVVGDEATAGGAGTGSTPGNEPVATEPAPPDTEPEPEPDPVAPPSGAECIPGTWTLRSQEFLDSIISAMGPAAAEITEWSHSGGQYVARFDADGSLLNERQDWQLRIGTAQGTIVSTISSSDPGSWSVADDQLTIEDFGSQAEVKLQIEVGGALQDLPIGGTQTVGTDPISGTGTYSCDGDVLTAMVTPAGETVMVQAIWDRNAG